MSLFSINNIDANLFTKIMENDYILSIDEIEKYKIPLGKNALEIPEKMVCPYCGDIKEQRGIVNPFKGLEVMKWSTELHCDCEGFKHAKMQEEQERLLELKRIEREQEEKKRKEVIRRCNIHAEFQDKNFNTFQITSENMPIFNTINKYIENIDKALRRGKGLYIFGDCGVGKTHLAVAMAHELINKEIDTLFSTVTEYLNSIKSTFNGDGESEEIRDIYSNVEVLILDDIGKENATSWSAEEVFALIDSRYRNCKTTIYTSNFTLEELKNIYEKSKKYTGKSIESRLYEKNVQLNLRGMDYRKHKF